MLSLIFITVFLFCIAIAAAGILVSHQFITTYNTEFHRSYFYYLVTFYAFAFYGIWGQVLMREFLLSLDTGIELIEMVAGFLPILGLPFLFISWIMLVKMAYSLVEITAKKNVVFMHFVILVIVISLAWISITYLDEEEWLAGEQLTYLEIGFLTFIEFLYFIVFVGIVLYKLNKQHHPNRKIFKVYVILMILGLIVRGIVLPFSLANSWILAPIILLYFASNFLPLFYLKLNSDLVFKPIQAEKPNEKKMDLIFRKYKITKRECEIVRQICTGKTNQQIADELFISLQTVKDHTHRIYSKIGIKSRMHLVQILNG